MTDEVTAETVKETLAGIQAFRHEMNRLGVEAQLAGKTFEGLTDAVSVYDTVLAIGEIVMEAVAEERKRCAAAMCWICRGEAKSFESEPTLNGAIWFHRLKNENGAAGMTHCGAQAIWNLEDE